MVWSEEKLCPIGVVIWLGFAAARAHQGQWFRQGVAALHASDGRGVDRSRVVAERGLALSCATVATAADGVTNGSGDERGVER